MNEYVIENQKIENMIKRSLGYPEDMTDAMAMEFTRRDVKHIIDEYNKFINN